MPCYSRLACVTLLAIAVAQVGPCCRAETKEADTPEFETHIAALLVRRCLECHQEHESSGGLSLATRAGLLRGGASGAAIVPGSAAESYLVRRVAAGEMPPEKKGVSQRLSATEIEQLRRWVQAGADWPTERTLDIYEKSSNVRGGRDWWSLAPIVRVEPRDLQPTASPGNSIDAFIGAKLALAGVEPAPLANRRQLIRRVYYDLLGLPPTYEEVEAYASNDHPGAWEEVVDRLLDAPEYGERWARYWLDLVRFAETCGYERDQAKPNAWRYRDWVVDALNRDMPFDRFVTEQLAGDELPDRSESSVVATGFLRLGTWNDEPNDPQNYKYERLEDLVHVTSSAFLGLTVKCARCHDHKFDPIPQTDYYRLAAVFWPGSIEPRDSKLLGGPTAAELGFQNVLGWTDLSNQVRPLHLLKQGDRRQPGRIVAAGPLSAVRALEKPFAPAPTGSPTTTRRLQLAQWIVDRQNPLTARVLVNRLWQHHFGAGLVRTPNNFGFRGERPTHPKLLDWLADELLQGDWKLKRMHKQILMSRTYRQSSTHPHHDQCETIDAENRLWWRAPRRRLDAEALRDSMLFVTGELNPTMGGPSFRASIAPDALEGLSRKEAAWQASPLEQQNRRSLYMYSKRSLLTPMMTTFDFCDTVAPCGQRDVTTAATQALALLNNSFAHSRSRKLAERVVDSNAENSDELVRWAWRYGLARLPTAIEQQLAAAFLEQQQQRFSQGAAAVMRPQQFALESLCHVLINSNEFIYVD